MNVWDFSCAFFTLDTSFVFCSDSNKSLATTFVLGWIGISNSRLNWFWACSRLLRLPFQLLENLGEVIIVSIYSLPWAALLPPKCWIISKKLENRAFFCSKTPADGANISSHVFGEIFLSDEILVFYELFTLCPLDCNFAGVIPGLSPFEGFLTSAFGFIVFIFCTCFFWPFYFWMVFPLVLVYFLDCFPD